MTINKGSVVVGTEEFVLDYIKHYEMLLKYTKQSVKHNRIKKELNWWKQELTKRKVYVVLKDIYEANAFSAEKLFIDIFLKEEDAKAKVKELSEPYNDIYYEEVEIK